MGRVVVDVQQAQQLGPVEQWRRADRVVPLLHDRCADALAARVLAVPAREQRPPRRHSQRWERADREASDRVKVLRREAATHAGDGFAAPASEEDSSAIRIEEDHRVVDQARQDPVEVEPAADVARDAPERVGAVQLVADLVGLPGGAHDRADRDGDAAEQVAVKSRWIGARSRVDDQCSPRPLRCRGSPRPSRAARR